jgi:hypothetical protein
MIKFFLKNVLACVVVLAASFTANAQFTIINENFQSWAFDGYGTTNPGSVYNGTNNSDCETSSSSSFLPVGQAVSIPVTKTYGSLTVTYTIDSGSVAPMCYPRGGTNTTCAGTSTATIPPSPTAAPNAVSRGYVMLAGSTANPSSRGRFTTSVLTNVTTLDLGLSATGSARYCLVQKSIDGGTTWTNIIDAANSDPNGRYPANNINCDAYGQMITGIPVNEPTVRLRIKADTTKSAGQRVRIHDFIVHSSVSGIQDAAWAQAGVSTSLENNNLTLTSNNVAGTVDVVSITGAMVGQKEIQKGGQAYFVMPASGLYMVRFTSSDNKIYTKKIVVN